MNNNRFLKSPFALSLGAAFVFASIGHGAIPLSAELTTSHHLRYWTEGDNAGSTVYNTFEDNHRTGIAGPNGSRRIVSPIYGFELPTLENDLSGATYTIPNIGRNQSPDWFVQIYIFEPNVTPSQQTPADIFWADPQDDPNPDLRLIDSEAYSITDEGNDITLNLTASMLDGFYNPDGTPASMMWFRSNPGETVATLADNTFQRFQSDTPSLSVSQIPEPGTYALFGGIGALLVVVGARRFRLQHG